MECEPNVMKVANVRRRRALRLVCNSPPPQVVKLGAARFLFCCKLLHDHDNPP